MAYLRRVMGVALVCAFVFASQSALAAEPLTAAKIESALKSGGITQPRLVTLVNQRGVDFVLTPKVEQRLRAAGAGDELIGAIRKASRKIATKPSSEASSSSLTTGSSAAAPPRVNLEAAAPPVEPVRKLRGAEGVGVLAFSPDGRWLASGSAFNAGPGQLTIRVWDVASGQERHTLRSDGRSVQSLAFSPDGGRLAFVAYDPRIVRVWDAATGRLADGKDLGEDGVRFSADGRWLATQGRSVFAEGRWQPTKVALWDTATWQRRTFMHGTGAEGAFVALSGDGGLLASSDSKGVIKLWDTATGRELRELPGLHQGTPGNAAFSPDGRWFASSFPGTRTSSSSDWGEVWVKLSDVRTGELRTLGGGDLRGSGGFVVFSPDGQLLAAASSYDVKFWEIATGQLLRTLASGGTTTLAISPDGRWLASGSNISAEIYIWDLRALRGKH